MVWPFSKKKEIENPALKAALSEHERMGTPQTHLMLLQQLNTAKYIVPSMEGKGFHDLTNGKIDKNTKYNFLLCADPSDKPILPLFTDMNELKLWSSKAVSIFILLPQNAWSFISPNVGISGVIINPASSAYVMGIESIEWLKQHPL